MTHGMVCAPQPEAVEAGALVLAGGGNAVDAAVVCALVQTVVDPCMCGLAGFGTLHLFLPAKGFHGFIDFHARAPAAVTPEMWSDRIEGEARDGFGFFLRGRVNEIGYQAIMAPGTVRALAEALAEHGTLSWREALAPALEQAREGFMVRPHVHAFWTQPDDFGRVTTLEKLRFSATGRRCFLRPDGAPKRPGERVENPDLATTLERLAEGGPELFHSGALAEEMCADIAAHGGLLAYPDLAGYRTTREEPLWGEYRGHRIATNRPPGGGVLLVEMLNILAHFDLAALGHNSPEYLRVVGEAMKQATADKDVLIGDPDFVEVPLERLAGAEHAAAAAERIARREPIHVERLPGAGEPRDTTQVCAVDEHGNAVSLTHSLGMPSGVISDGLGFMYNGCMGVFDPRPGRPGSLAPGKRRFTAMCPTLVFRDERPWLVLGAPGGTWITMGVLQVILNLIDFGMSPLEAVAAPRFTANSDVIDVCNRIPRFVTGALEDQGYAVARSPLSYTFAGVHLIASDRAGWRGAADPGRDGMALAV